MDSRTIFRRLLCAPAHVRTSLISARAPAHFSTPPVPNAQQQRDISLPRTLQPAFWTSLLPKPFRLSSPSSSTTTSSALSSPSSKKQWNPYTSYLILSLLIGSQAIQTIWLKQERTHRANQAEARLDVLREVIERVQKGEEVDVEGALGVGEEEGEKRWADVMKQVRDEEVLYRSKRSKKEGSAKKDEKHEKDSAETSDMKANVKMERSLAEEVGGVKFY